MNPEWTKRFTDTQCWDASLILAIIYTFLYAGMVIALIIVNVPTTNEKTLDILIGIMSGIQMSIVNRYFGGSKSADDAQIFAAQNKERTDAVLRETVKEVAKDTKGAPNGNN